MTTRQAPEIFQIPLDDLDPAGLPPRGTAEFEQAVIGRYALDYAARGWQAVVAVDDAFVRVVAVPERGVEPKAYVLGLLQNGFLEDALPVLEALDGMLDDAELRGSTLHPDFRPFSESASSAGAGLTAATAEVLWWHVCNRLT